MSGHGGSRAPSPVLRALFLTIGLDALAASIVAYDLLVLDGPTTWTLVGVGLFLVSIVVVVGLALASSHLDSDADDADGPSSPIDFH